MSLLNQRENRAIEKRNKRNSVLHSPSEGTFRRRTQAQSKSCASILRQLPRRWVQEKACCPPKSSSVQAWCRRGAHRRQKIQARATDFPDDQWLCYPLLRRMSRSLYECRCGRYVALLWSFLISSPPYLTSCPHRPSASPSGVQVAVSRRSAEPNSNSARVPKMVGSRASFPPYHSSRSRGWRAHGMWRRRLHTAPRHTDSLPQKSTEATRGEGGPPLGCVTEVIDPDMTRC